MKSLVRCVLNEFKNLLAGSFGRNMKFYYCTKDAHSYSGRRSWPPGDYCILKHGRSCPKGNIYYFFLLFWKYHDRLHCNCTNYLVLRTLIHKLKRCGYLQIYIWWIKKHPCFAFAFLNSCRGLDCFGHF